jgi:hypothetical protein
MALRTRLGELLPLNAEYGKAPGWGTTQLWL